MSTSRFTATQLRSAATAALGELNVPEADARVVADTLVEAELTGQPGHGLSRLPFLLDRLRQGLINPRPVPRIVAERSAAALLDADNGLGPIAGVRAADLAAERARACGIGLVAVRHSNHIGAVSYYVRRCAHAGLIGMAFSNGPPAMSPPGGSSAYLGTNPIAAAFPSVDGPIVVDMATSQVARGHILRAARAGEPIPPGWALDVDGRPTTDAAAALAGSLMPLGGAKGFALAVMVELLSGVLAGAAVGPEVTGTFTPSDRESDVGHSFLAVDAEALQPGYAARAGRLAEALRAAGGRAPGDRGQAERARREREGIDLSNSLLVGLRERGLPL